MAREHERKEEEEEVSGRKSTVEIEDEEEEFSGALLNENYQQWMARERKSRFVREGAECDGSIGDISDIGEALILIYSRCSP